MARRSYRVDFPSGSGQHTLAGIVDKPTDTDAPIVVFSHCFTCNKDLKSIVRISRALADDGIAVLRFDMTGLGGSQGDFSQTNFTTNCADLRSAIEFAGKEIGPVTALIGHSFGGAASMAVAGAYPPADLKALVTLAAPSDTGHLADLLLRMNSEIGSKGRGEVEIGGYRWQIDRQMVDDFRKYDLSQVIPNIKVPTVIVHSIDDETLAFDQAINILNLIRQNNPNVSISALAKAGHLLTEQENWQNAATVIASFLHRHA